MDSGSQSKTYINVYPDLVASRVKFVFFKNNFECVKVYISTLAWVQRTRTLQQVKVHQYLVNLGNKQARE